MERLDYGTAATAGVSPTGPLLGLLSIACGFLSIAGGRVYVLTFDQGRLFEEGGWQWFNENFPFRTVRIVAVVGILAAVRSIIVSRRPRAAPLVGLLLSTVGVIAPWRW